ncbi:DNA-binding protein [Mycolicibacterium novocastrense]|nr:DNA-binding protein [Mycolicibacterium novocastrense]
MNYTRETSPGEATEVDPIIFAPQLSTMLGGVPLGTIRYWDSTGFGPRSFKLGKRRAWRLSVVRQWLEAQESGGGNVA